MSLRERWREWFFRRQTATSGWVLLQQRQIYILPSRVGVLYAAVLVVMYIGAVNYNLGLGHALVFLLVGLGLTGMLHTFRNLAGLGLRAGKCRPVFAGEQARFEILLDNRRAESRPAIRLQQFQHTPLLRLQKKAANATLPLEEHLTTDLPGNHLTSVVLPVVARRRGQLTLGRLSLSTTYPLGLFRAWSYPWPSARCLVYPAPLYRPLPPLRASDRASGNERHSSDSPDDFAGFRRHHPGDSPRHVAWKVYARSTSDVPLLVKEFSGNGAAECCLDWDLTSPNEDVETRLSTLCGWVLQARQANIDFSLRLPGLELPVGQGEPQAERALEALALFGERP